MECVYHQPMIYNLRDILDGLDILGKFLLPIWELEKLLMYTKRVVYLDMVVVSLDIQVEDDLVMVEAFFLMDHLFSWTSETICISRTLRTSKA